MREPGAGHGRGLFSFRPAKSPLSLRGSCEDGSGRWRADCPAARANRGSMSTTASSDDPPHEGITAHELDEMELRRNGDDIQRLCHEVRRFRARLGLGRSATPTPASSTMRRFLPVKEARRVRPGLVFTQWETDPPLIVTRVVGFVPGIGDGALVLAFDVRHATQFETAKAHEDSRNERETDRAE
jgi:hypothetical protein